MLISSYRDWQGVGLSQEQFLEIKYEDILSNPEQEISRLVQFCDLDWTEDFRKQLNRFNIQSSRKDAYLQDLGAERLEELEAVIAEPLTHYGYKSAQERRM